MSVKNVTIGSPLTTLSFTLKPNYNRAILYATSTISKAKVNISSVNETITQYQVHMLLQAFKL